MKRLHAVFGLIVSLALTGTAWAGQGKGQSRGKGKKPEVSVSEKEKGKLEARGEKGARPGHAAGFGSGDADKIRGWFRTNRTGLPPGLAKREELPPGLQKYLVRNGTLPPGLQKKLQPLPPQLEVELPGLPMGYKRFVIGANVILVEERTSRIVDLIPDVIVIR